jgi:hypothetical protein
VLDAGLQRTELVARAWGREDDSRAAAYALVDAFLSRMAHAG